MTNPEKLKNDSGKPEIPRFLIGKKGEILENPKWLEGHPEYQAQLEETRRQNLEDWQKSLEIPEDVKPGTGEMLLETTKRQIRINERSLNSKGGKDAEWRRLNESTKNLESLRDLYYKVQETIRGEIWDGERSTLKGVEEKLKDMPAIEMVDYVDQYIEKTEEEGKHDPETYAPIIKTAEDLKTRLLDEANRERKG